MNTNIKLVLPDLSYRIMGVLFSVHNELGPRLLEKYYQRAVEQELKEQNITYNREISVPLMYKQNSIGKYILDFIVEKQVVLELKANNYSSPRFFKQALTYLKHTNLPLAILVNFRREKLEYKRIINSGLLEKYSKHS